MPILGGPEFANNILKIANHTPPASIANLVIEGNGNIVNGVRKRLYDKVSPYGYQHVPQRVASALLLDNKIQMATANGFNYENLPSAKLRDEIFAEYLNIPVEQRHYNVRLEKSKYKPSIRTTNNGTYYVSPTNKSIRAQLIEELNDPTISSPLASGRHRERTTDGVLGSYTLSRGRDSRGDYISYYDSWDLSPFHGANGRDESLGIGKPVEFYNRFYLDDIIGLTPNSRKGTYWLPPIEITYDKRTKNTNVNWDPHPLIRTR